MGGQGNPKGRGILADLDQMREDTARLTKTTESMKEDFKATNEELKEELNGMKALLHAMDSSFLAVRNRYLENYRKRILGWPSDYRLIIQSNDAAHSGDALYDAMIYSRGYRQDQQLLLKIYGLNQHEILELDKVGDTESIAILNARATLRADTQCNVDKDLDIAWRDFIAVLKSNWGQNMQADPISDITRCRAAFWKIATQYGEFFQK